MYFIDNKTSAPRKPNNDCCEYTEQRKNKYKKFICY